MASTTYDFAANLGATNYNSLPVDDLLQQCAENTADSAWLEFVQRFDALITSIVRRTCREWPGTPPDVVDDLIQETYLKLCANNFSLLVNFQFRHENAFPGCIKTVATNVVYDFFSSAHASKRDVDNNLVIDNPINYLHKATGVLQYLTYYILMDQLAALYN